MVWITADGTRDSRPIPGFLNANGSLTFRVFGANRRPVSGLTIWIEEDGLPGQFGEAGVRVSNELKLAN
jgi:hypothetical protein